MIVTDDENSVEDPIEDSNHILVTAIPPTGGVCFGLCQLLHNTLAEAFYRNTEPKLVCDSVWLTFMTLRMSSLSPPLRHSQCVKPWDHVIELVPDVKPVNARVYPLAPQWTEGTWWIHSWEPLDRSHLSSKLPMAFHVFFIKKKGW